MHVLWVIRSFPLRPHVVRPPKSGLQTRRTRANLILGKLAAFVLNAGVRSTQKHRFSRSGNTFLWLLVILMAAGVAWVLWKAAKTKPHPVKAPLSSASAAKAPAVLPPVTISNAPPARPRTNAPLVVTAAGYPRAVQTPFEAQLALERQGISAGSLDGKIGSQTRAAIRAFQRQAEIPITGELDANTKSNLTLSTPPITTYVVTSDDLARLQPLSKTWTGKSQQTALDYETILELVAEKSHSHPALIKQMNPAIDWANVVAGTALQVPDVTLDDPPGKAAFARISLSENILEAFDTDSNLLVHFPCSIAQKVEKRPVGELHVAVVAPNPNYTFDPQLFPESAEAKEAPDTKLIIPPGPNNPVGVVWIGLDKPGYGMHGTPRPEDVGRTESHGCFRLANWNAELLLKITWVGMPVYVEP
jgi:lipoprotein-anchoring transpeptidase ErfK/SrfK